MIFVFPLEGTQRQNRRRRTTFGNMNLPNPGIERLSLRAHKGKTAGEGDLDTPYGSTKGKPPKMGEV